MNNRIISFIVCYFFFFYLYDDISFEISKLPSFYIFYEITLYEKLLWISEYAIFSGNEKVYDYLI